MALLKQQIYTINSPLLTTSSQWTTIKLMYSFKSRFSRGAVIPVLFLFVFLANTLSKYFNHEVTLLDAINLTIQIIVIITIGYLAAVAFLSLETIIHMLMRKETTVSTLIHRAQGRSLGRNFEVMEKWDLQEPYKLTNSILFVAILLALSIYAVTVESALVGQIMVLTILFLFLAEQGIRLSKGSDLNSWYWQVRRSVPRDSQVAVYALMGVIYIWVVFMAMF